MASYMPKFSAEMYEEILYGITPREVGRTVLEICPLNPELDDRRTVVIRDSAESPPAFPGDMDALSTDLSTGVGFDAGRYVLTVAGIKIPRVQNINPRFFLVPPDFESIDTSYMRASFDWCARHFEGNQNILDASFGFGELYVAVSILTREHIGAN